MHVKALVPCQEHLCSQGERPLELTQPQATFPYFRRNTTEPQPLTQPDLVENSLEDDWVIFFA